MLLLLLLIIPIAAAAAILLGAPARRTANGAAWLNLLITICVFAAYNSQTAGYQEMFRFPILPDWGLQFFLGVDGLSIIMLLLTSIVTVAAVWVAPAVERNQPAYFASLLFISAGAIGAFSSLDLFFFYAFHELALVPTFLLIGIWGTGDRQTAAWKITIYLSVGSFILLLGLLGLYLSFPVDHRTFDITVLQQQASLINPGSRNSIYLALLIGFGILISLFPFHTWAPSAYASAPTPAAMLHAGVIKKFGLYGLLRVALPLLPDAARHYSGLLLVLLVGNIIYVGLVTIGQKRLDMMLGYSSVMHMGYIFLGIASFNAIGTTGAALLMFAHGLSIAALFAVAGQVRERTGTLSFAELGGLAKPMPVLGFVFGLAAFAAIGLPGFANFASEILVFFGAYQNGATPTHLSHIRIATICALWGVVISSVYMLRGYRAVFHGEIQERWAALKDITSLRWPIILLLAALLLIGFFPQIFVHLVQPVIAEAVKGAIAAN